MEKKSSSQLKTLLYTQHLTIAQRAFIGTHHKMSAKYLPLYLNEFTFRFNRNGNGNMFKTVLSNAIAA